MVTKDSIARKIAVNHGTSFAEARRITNEIFDIIKNEVVNGEKVFISDFGTFSVSERKERKCKNPQTKEDIIVPAKNVPAFKSSETFKSAVKVARENKK